MCKSLNTHVERSFRKVVHEWTPSLRSHASLLLEGVLTFPSHRLLCFTASPRSPSFLDRYASTLVISARESVSSHHVRVNNVACQLVRIYYAHHNSRNLSRLFSLNTTCNKPKYIGEKYTTTRKSQVYKFRNFEHCAHHVVTLIKFDPTRWIIRSERHGQLSGQTGRLHR